MTKLESFFEYINGKTVALVGLGISNAPLVELLVSHGANISAHDKKGLDELSPSLAALLEKCGARLCLGASYLDDINADIIIKAPGIRKDAKGLCEAVARGAYLTSEMELFFKLTDCEKIAITGSDGKTTTTTLTYLMLSEAYKGKSERVYVGGNIGKPLFSIAESIRPNDIAVLELSSFQLHAMESCPTRAAITNVSPNHLDWHTDYDEYIDSKKRIFSFMDTGIVVLNHQNEISREMARDIPSGCTLRYFTSGDPREVREDCTVVYRDDREIFVRDPEQGKVHIMSVNDILIPGDHNVENYMTAIALLYGRVDNSVFVDVARSFKGVEHRCELVCEKDGVKYYNSSIDSSPTRTMAALNSFKNKKVIAIMGGYNKHIPYDVLGDCVCEHTRAVVLTGATAPKIRDAITSCSRAAFESPEIFMIDNFAEAVHKARSIACPGDIVILTPASASFDRFKNFEERGHFFSSLVKD